jgi:pilus assembly protein CpaE
VDAWILSDSASLSNAIRRSLLRVDIDCPPARQVGLADFAKLAGSAGEHGPVVFLGLHQLSLEHVDLVRAIRQLTDKEVVVVASSADRETLLKTIRAGATDFLEANHHLDDEIQDFVHRTKVEGPQLARRGRVITVVPCNAPCDGSVLAVNIAAVIAQKAGDCAILDLHLRGGDLSLLLKTSARHTILDLVGQRDRLDENMLRQAMATHSSGVALLAGPPMFSDLRDFEPAACHQILRLAQSSYRFVVVNCEDIAHDEQMQSLAASDDIVLALRKDLVSLHRAKQTIEFMVRNRVAASRVHVVAMGTGLSGELPSSAVSSVLGIARLHLVPDDQATTAVSINVGNPLVLEAPKTAIARSMVAFVESLPGLAAVARPAARWQSWFGRAAAALAVTTGH